MLYQTYRPHTWETIIGQNHVTGTLTQELISKNVGHAFLFTGPRGTGKTTTARLLAKSLQCVSRAADSANPCSACIHCTELQKGAHIDIIEIDAASHTGVDNVRENIIEATRVRPAMAAYKIFIIDEVHMLSASAFNALLKTLEEPPAHVKFILATTELHKVPATIVSRCERFTFHFLSIELITQKLSAIAAKENKKIDADVLTNIAWRAGGSMRDGESILGQLLSFPETIINNDIAAKVLPPRANTEIIGYIAASLAGNPKDAWEIITHVAERGAHIPHVYDECIDTLRTLLLYKVSGAFGISYFNEKDRLTLEQVAASHEIGHIARFIEILLRRRMSIGTTPLLTLPLELAAIEMSVAPQRAALHQPAQKKSVRNNGDAEKIKNTETDKAPHIPAHTEPVPTIDVVHEKWEKLLEHLQTLNHSLPLIIKTCAPLRVESNVIIVKTPYSFHAKRIEEPIVKNVISKALLEIFHSPITMSAEIDESTSKDTDAVVAKVLETFGGNVL